MKRLAIILGAVVATFPAWAQKEDAMGNTKVNTDFSKYKTFTWAKSDPHMVGPEGYDIYYYEISPERSYDKDMNRTEDMNRNRDLDKTDQTQKDQTYRDQTQRDQTQRDQSYNRRDTTDQTRITDEERAASDRMTDKTYTDPNKDKSTDPNQTYNRDKETDDMNNPRRTDTYQNENKPSGYTYSYTMIIPARDAAANEAIKDGISNELEGRGFREGSEGADLIVSYQVLDQKATLHGFKNDSPVTTTGGEEVRQPSDTATFALEPGTLMVSLIDSNTSEMVWHGWSSGLIENRSFLTDEAELKEAIHKIFEEFKHTAAKADKSK